VVRAIHARGGDAELRPGNRAQLARDLALGLRGLRALWLSSGPMPDPRQAVVKAALNGDIVGFSRLMADDFVSTTVW